MKLPVTLFLWNNCFTWVPGHYTLLVCLLTFWLPLHLFCWFLFISLTPKCWSNLVYFLDFLSCLYSLDGLTQSYGFKYYVYADDSKFISQLWLSSKLCPWILVPYTQLSTWYLHLAELLIALALSLMLCPWWYFLPWICSFSLSYIK